MHRRVWVAACAFSIAALAMPAGARAQGFGSLSKLKKKAEEIEKKKPDAAKPEETKPEEKKKADEPKTETTAPAAATGKKDVGGQPDLADVKIDFVPGERTVFYDDFSDMAPDEPPPHWKVRGGTVSLKVGGDVHELSPGEGTVLTSPKISVPKDFTFELVCDCKGEIDFKLQNASDENVLEGGVEANEEQTSVTANVEAKESLGNGEIKTEPGLLTFALWAQQGRVRAYLNGERIVDANQVDFAGIDHIVLHPSRYRHTDIRSIRLAESAPDFGTTLSATGKYVSHGIYFDTDSDRIKPESAAVLKMIAGALTKNPNLKLTINGYTDSTGNADHNLDLSKRRAAAVQSVLVSQFGVDAGRLSADGFGPKDPIASNDTADGRAQNRRVEFVKQ